MVVEEDITFSFPIGGAEYARNALWVARSLHATHEDPHIITSIRTPELEKVSRDIIDEISSCSELITVERPIPEYPISVKIATLSKASTISNRPILVHLDSDILVLQSIPDMIPNNIEVEDWIQTKPVDLSGQYWARKESFNDWQDLCADVGLSFKGNTHRSAVGNNPIPPYFNAGVVAMANGDLPDEWLNITKSVWDRFESRNSDQVALSLLTQRHTRCVLDNKHSWNLPTQLHVPTETVALRYEDFIHLNRIINPKIRLKINNLGLSPVDEIGGIRNVPTAIARSLQQYISFRKSE